MTKAQEKNLCPNCESQLTVCVFGESIWTWDIDEEGNLFVDEQLHEFISSGDEYFWCPECQAKYRFKLPLTPLR